MSDYPELRGKRAVVTGASTGIGEAAARALAAQGVHVAVVAGTRLADAERIASDLRVRAPDSFATRADVTSPDDVRRLFSEIRERFSRIDILVNNAGGLGGAPRRQFLDLPVEEWDRVIDLNLTSVFLCCREVLPSMKEQGFGRVINTSSEVARSPVLPIAAHYTAGKTAVSVFTAYLAREVAAYEITVTAFAPSTTLTAGLKTRFTAEALEAIRTQIPLGRLAEPEDQANVVVLLASDAARALSGTTVDVTGGKITI
ncbi:MAG: SDR family oxidoreductase [Armatimonadetes bacterium]|nr:SDR family oxidoreductase [Armatimonadota bacterium]